MNAIQMPELQGTEKQVAWANDIRSKFVAEMSEFNEGDRGDFQTNFSHLVDALHDFNTNKELTYAVTDGAEENSTIAQAIIPQVRELGLAWAGSVNTNGWIEIARNPFRGFVAANHDALSSIIVAAVQSN